ncbi:bacteriocin biosynthesis protein SagD [Haloprofundus marisrubri]|uniref:Bacteriocin biosynthesis protein SagD n=1 Tax=Haloprofundus marisrubri TaxID=1514971 RepID=A0A0W1R4N6_9EURY|nr:YcaO-like family protein [Haloprofundus marisrubri]KTG08296.1 bacteriocin biosynthesis protein SagD [Haloprofundus marisrubri]
MHVGLVGSGPAAESLRAAFADIDAQVSETTTDALSKFDFAAVVAPAGSDAFARANDRCERWVAVEVGGVGGHPLASLDASVSLFDADSGCFHCLRARVASNLDDDAAERPRGDRAAVRLAGAVAGRRAVSLLSGDDIAGTVVEVPGPEREFHPAPGCDCADSRDRTLSLAYRDADVDDSLARAERALDDRVGLVRSVGERESFPVPYYFAQTADTTVFSDARAAEFAAGVDADWNPAFMKALGEALERYCAGVYRNSEFVTASETNRANPVSPRRFVRPDGWETVSRDESIPWVEGVDLGSEERVSLPAEFVQFPPPNERHKPAITTGLGLGNSTAEACLSGLYEVLERDATMLAWYSTFDPLELVVDDDGFETLVGRARAESLSVTPLLVTQDIDVPVVAAAVHREGGDGDEAESWPRFAVGSGADLDAAAAARSALAEALQNWTELRAMGPERAAGESGAIGEYADFPRAARRFVDASGRVRADDVGTAELSGVEELETVVSRASTAGVDTYAARVTTPDVAKLGFEAVRVVAPEAQPLFTGETFFGDRARNVPADLGFDPRLDAPFHPYP